VTPPGSAPIRSSYGVALPCLPQHLLHTWRPLREQGLVTITPKGRSNVYSMCCEALAGSVKLLATLAALTPEGADACCWG
jgi:hypothetical protein